MENMANKKIGIKDILPYKSFLTMLFANMISRFGDSIDVIAYGWMIYQMTGSTLLLGSIFAVNAIPGVLFSAFTGVLVDRLPKKIVIIISDLGRGLIVSLTAYLFFVNLLEPWHLFLFTFINSTFETFASPAKMSLLPLFLPKELYLSANSLSSSSISFSELIGTGIAAVLIGKFGVSGAIFLDGLTFFISASLMFFIRIQEDVQTQEPLSMKSYLDDLKIGFNFIRKETIILITVLLFGLVNFSLTPISSLMPAYTKDTLKTGPEGLSLMGVSLSMGMILGGLIIANFGNRFKKKAYITVSGLAIMGCSYTFLSLPEFIKMTNLHAIILGSSIFFIMGMMIPMITAPLKSHLLTNTPRNLLGRVAGITSVVTLSAMPFGGAFSGAMADVMSIPTLYLIMGGLLILISFLPLLNKDFRNA